MPRLGGTLLAAAIIVTLPAEAAAQRCAGTKGGRVALIGGAYAVGQASAILIRRNDWWTTPTTGFHFETASSPSKDQDRLLHAALGYQTAQAGALLFDWACVPHELAGWLGAALGAGLALPKEIGDGVHEGKGFSAPDVVWTAVGALAPALHRSWPVTRTAQLKVNYWPSDEYRTRNQRGGLPQLENDYAGQRYFLAIDPGLAPGGAGAWPDWLGIAVGHSVPHWVTLPPINQWYVTLDLSLRGLPIRAPWWRKVAALLDQVHLPLPGIKIEAGDVKLGLY